MPLVARKDWGNWSHGVNHSKVSFLGLAADVLANLAYSRLSNALHYKCNSTSGAIGAIQNEKAITSTLF